jgi:hypothetical protein
MAYFTKGTHAGERYPDYIKALDEIFERQRVQETCTHSWTTVGGLAHRYNAQGKSVVFGRVMPTPTGDP